jgi:hypothetical protein
VDAVLAPLLPRRTRGGAGGGGGAGVLDCGE